MSTLIGAPSAPSKRIAGKERQSAITAAKGVCAHCGLTSLKFHEVVERGSAHLVLCPFCFIVDSIERGDGKGRLIWCPELTQAQLNHLVVVCWMAKSQGEKRGVAADGILAQLYAKHYDIEDILFDGASYPGKMAQALRGVTSEMYGKREKYLASVRFLPAEKAFADHVEHWKATNWSTISDDVWTSLYNSARRG